MRCVSLYIIALIGTNLLAGVSGAQALTMKQCSAKYQAAEQAGTIQGMKWKDFRKTECASNASANPVLSPAAVSSKPNAGAKGRVEDRRLKAMQDAAQKDLASANAQMSKARLLRPTQPEQDDPNIAAALAAASGKPPAPQSLSERLAALKAH